MSDNFCPCAAIPDIPEDDAARRARETLEDLAAHTARFLAAGGKLERAKL